MIVADRPHTNSGREWRDGNSRSDVSYGLTPGSRDLGIYLRGDLGLRGWACVDGVQLP